MKIQKIKIERIGDEVIVCTQGINNCEVIIFVADSLWNYVEDAPDEFKELVANTFINFFESKMDDLNNRGH
jgi:hypothetical protein